MVYSIQRELDPTFKPLKLSFKQEEQLQGLFFQYISLGKVGGRKNRLNYHFVLGKLADMLEYKFIHPIYIHQRVKSLEKRAKSYGLKYVKT